MNNRASRRKVFCSEAECKEFAAHLHDLGAIGTARAIHAKPLMVSLKIVDGITGNGACGKVRELSHWAPFYGIPIVSSKHGYFIATNVAELGEAARLLESSATTMQQRAVQIRTLAVQFGEAEAA